MSSASAAVLFVSFAPDGYASLREIFVPGAFVLVLAAGELAIRTDADAL